MKINQWVSVKATVGTVKYRFLHFLPATDLSNFPKRLLSMIGEPSATDLEEQ